MTGARRRHRRSLKAASFQDYKDLALASGGQAIQVTKAQLPQATDVILDTSTSALVWPVLRVHSVLPETCMWPFWSRWITFIVVWIRWQFFSEQGPLGRRKLSPSCWMNLWKTSQSTSQEHRLHLHCPTHQVPHNSLNSLPMQCYYFYLVHKVISTQ